MRNQNGGRIEDEAQALHDRLQPISYADISLPPPATPISKYQVTATVLTDLQTTSTP